MLPRSLSAVAQSCASNPRLAPLLFACFAIESSSFFLRRGNHIPGQLFQFLGRHLYDNRSAVSVYNRGLGASEVDQASLERSPR